MPEGKGKIKLLWGFLILIGAVLTQYMHLWTKDLHPYIGAWFVIGLIGVLGSSALPHARRIRDKHVGLLWLILAVIGILLTISVGEGLIGAPLYSIPLMWMAVIGIGAVLTGVIEQDWYFSVPGFVLLIVTLLTSFFAVLIVNAYIVFGLGFGAPLMFSGLIEEVREL